ncbi:hypothetical protein CAPTEDRAFT_207982, partial [Capitella teleta]
EEPFVEVSGGSYNGLFVDLLSKISKNIDVDIEIKTTTGPSYKTDDGHWRGVVQKVTEREGDLGGPLTATFAQDRVTDQTHSFMSSGIALVAKKPRQPTSNSFCLFLGPFRATTWVIITIVTLLACGILFFLTRRWSLKGKACKPPAELQCFRCFFYSYALLLSSLYLAHLTAIILGATKGQMASPIQSVEDLVKQSVVRYGVVRNGHAHNFIQMS